MMKRTSKTVVSLCLSAVMLFFALFSCQTDTAPTDSQAPTVNAGSIEQVGISSVNTGGTIDFSGFADGGNAKTFSSDHIFTFREVSLLSENITSVYHNYHAHTDGTLFTDALLEHDGERERVIIKIAPDMTTSTIPLPNDIPNLGYGESFGDYHIMDDGSMLISTYAVNIPIPGVIENPDFKGHLYHYSADGEMLASTAFDYGSRQIDILPNGHIVALEEDVLHVFADDLTRICTIPDAGTPSISPKGELFVQSRQSGRYTYIETEGYTSAQNRVYAPQNTDPTAAMYFSAAKTEYDAYFSDRTGFWGMQSGENEATLLCSWQDSGMTYGNIEIYAVLDEETLFGTLTDPFSDKGQLTGFFRRSENTQKPKNVITLGIVDNIKYRASDITLTDAVNRFNATNEDYFVDIVRYAGTGDDYQNGEIPDAFTEAMLSNTAADIIVSSDRARENMQTYREKGAFVDLSSAVSEVLIPAAANAFRQNDGTLCAIPMNMQLSVLCVNDFFMSDEDTLSLERVYALDSMARENGVRLSNAPQPDVLSAVAVPSFANYETGTCGFNTPEFASYVQFYESYLAQSHDDPRPFSHENGTYYISSPDLPAALRDDAFLLFETPFASMEAYAVLKLLYEEQGFTIHGYPARNSEVVYLQSELDFSINADTEVSLGAMTFLAFLLSDDIQESATLTDRFLPVTYSGIEGLLERRTYYFHRDRYENLGEYLGSRISYLRPDAAAYYLNSPYKDEQEQLLTVTLTDDDIAALRRLFYTSETRSLVDTTMTRIIEEELSAYRAGAQTLERTQEILQSRLFIYINE